MVWLKIFSVWNILGYDYGTITEKEFSLNTDALNIGNCKEVDSWLRCSGSCNNLEIGGICEDKSCKAGENAGVKLECHNC